MATLAQSQSTASEPAQHSSLSPEQALCDLFDVVEDAIEQLPVEKRKAWLDGLSATAETLERRS